MIELESSTEFDLELKKISSLLWKPWVGKEYSLLKGNKLLIVGESHYNHLPEQSIKESIGGTRSMIHSDGLYGYDKSGKEKHIFLRKTEQVLWSKKDISKKHRKILWPSVSFYNFIQSRMETKNHRPTKIDWQIGWQTFTQVIEILKPDYVLFCGVSAFNKRKDLSEAIIKNGFKLSIIKTSNEKVNGTTVKDIFTLTKNGETVTMCCMKHPSRACTYWKWSKIIKSHMPEYISWLRAQFLP